MWPRASDVTMLCAGRMSEHCVQALAFASYIIFILHGVVAGNKLGSKLDGPSVTEACANAFDYGDPTCQGNSTIYLGTGNGTDLSCAHCVCPNGWGGLDCGRCLDVSVCPEITENGKTLAATNCSSDTLLLTEEEASSNGGKVFSCSCGGGEDAWTDLLCGLQPDTWIQWAVTGGGKEGNASISIKEFAGIHARTEEAWPDQYKYHYPKVFEGSADSCKVYKDKCLPVDDTDVGERDCVIFKCGDTEGACPPEEYPMCDGFPNCRSPSGDKYVTHPCTAAPLTGTSITIACEEEKVNGSFVCYYQQPGGFAPMSMTCSVGSCLYHGGRPVPPSKANTKVVPWSTKAQMAILVALAVLLFIIFGVFFVASDSGTAKKLPRKFPWMCSKPKLKSLSSQEPLNGEVEELGEQELGRPLLEATGYGNSTGDDGGRPQPAMLRWTKLGYFVKKGVSALNHDEEFAVLHGVSGFAGPDQVDPRRNSSLPSSSERGNTPVNGFPGNIPLSEVMTNNNPPRSTMTGILGPSGAGKSSLLDVLAGRKREGEGRATGSILLSFSGEGAVKESNGDAAEAVRRVSGYVSQEDVLPGTLTCYEHLMFHARLGMPSGVTFIERRARVLGLLGEFGLERVADSRIGDELERGLSGGERRRLSIAAELVSRPSLLFLDEPTTGLDAATALRVVTLLKGVASRGTTVVCSLHQPRPRVFNQFDRVILLSKGRVAYSGTPGEAEAYFTSIGRPFPPGESTRQPADAMLALCSQEDGRDLPGLFRRSFMYAESIGNHYACGRSREERLAESRTGHPGVMEERENADVGPTLDSANLEVEGVSEADKQQPQDDHQHRCDVTGNSAHSEAGGFEGTELVRVRGRRRERRRGNPWRGGECRGEKAYVPFVVQVGALSRRLLLRAVRHPLLLVLHFGGSVAMALCLASVFGGRLDFTMEGAQNRFGALFFILLYLSLLSLTSLPVWREDRRLFLTETMGGAYGHLGYFTSVALVDVLLIRVLPPLAFAVVAYPLMGLNSAPDNHGCLLWFSGILVLTNVTVALAAMGVGALGLPLELSNLMGGLMVLLLAAFGRFLLNGTRIPEAWRWMSYVTPLGYAFEALLINEFTDESSSRPYRIEGSHCSPSLPLIEAQGPQILSTFSFSSSRTTRRVDTLLLGCLALALTASSLIIFFVATRTKPIEIKKSRGGRPGRASGFRRSRSVSTRSSRPEGRADLSKRSESESTPLPVPSTLLAPSVTPSHRDLETAGTPQLQDDSHPRSNDAEEGIRRNGNAARIDWIGTRRTVTWNLPEDDARSHGSRRNRGMRNEGRSLQRQQRRTRRYNDRSVVSSLPPLPLVLSWEGLRYSVPVSRERRLSLSGNMEDATSRTIGRSNAGDTSRAEGLKVGVLNGVSGFAGPSLLEIDESDDALGGEERPVLSGTVTAIMGPSGAGKTSLLNALAGRLEKRRLCCGGCNGCCLSGIVRINGVEVTMAKVREISAYVTQEDVLPETLTCHEHLMFHAHLRLRTSVERRSARVSEILEELGLTDVRDSLVGGGLSRGLSGGEKRRLSIATELLTCPALLFLDEPTTGLDSSTALRVMQLVSQVASRGTTVLCSVHQPRPAVVDLLNGVILLSRGNVAFAGRPEKAASYFASINRPFSMPPLGEAKGNEIVSEGSEVSPADAMLDVVGEAEALADQHGEGLIVMPEEVLLEQVHAAEESAPPPPPDIVSHGNTRSPDNLYSSDETRRTSPPISTQLSALLRRSALNVARDPYLAGLHVVLTVCVGVVVGTLFWDLYRLNGSTAGVQDRLGVMFLLLLYLSLLCLTSLAAWRKQMALFLHERASGAYGAAAHLATAAIADAVACRILPPFILAVAVRPLSGLREGSLGGMFGGLVAFNLSLAGVLAACGAASRSSQEALAMGCLVVLFSALLSGFLVAKDDLQAGWEVLAWLSPIGRGFEALVVNEFGPYGAIFRLSTKIGTAVKYSDYLTGDDVLHCFGFDGSRYWTDLGVLAAVGACGLGLALLFLKSSR